MVQLHKASEALSDRTATTRVMCSLCVSNTARDSQFPELLDAFFPPAVEHAGLLE